MTTECKVLKFDLETIALEEIETKIRDYCNDAFFSSRTIRTVSTSINGNTYYATIIYEHTSNLIAIFFVFIFLPALFAFLIWYYQNY